MTHVAFALGSNIGDRMSHLTTAVKALANSGDVIVTAVSKVYETKPVGGPEQDNYLNAVVVGESELGARDLLSLCHSIEELSNRTRDVRWGPRTLDVDLLLVGSLELSDEDIVVPHPRAHERGFVLEPWASIDAETYIPSHGTVAECLAAAGSDGVWLSEEQMNESFDK